MGPKLKALKNNWERCNLCECFVPTVDSIKHVGSYHGNQCKHDTEIADKSQNRSLTDKVSPPGFIKNGILHGIAKARRIKGEELTRLPASAIDNVIVMCPTAMTLCDLTIGSTALLWSNPNKFALQIAWPAKEQGVGQTELSLSCATMNLLSCKTGDVVHVQKLKPSHQLPASELTLLTNDEKSFYGSKEFVDFFRYTFDNQFILNGCPILTHFYGQICKLTVIEINKNKRQETGLNATGSDLTALMCRDLSSLSLNISQGAEDKSICDDVSFETSRKSSFSTTLEGAKGTLTSTPSRRSSHSPSTSISCDCHESRPLGTDFCFYCHSETKIRIVSSKGETFGSESERSSRKHGMTTFDDIGGLSRQIEEIRQFLFMSETALRTFSSYGLQPPRGIVLFGPSGTGKTLIGQAIANEMQNQFVSINGPEVYSKFLGETESKLKEIFAGAMERAPSVIFVDNIDTLCSKRSSSSTQQEQRVVSTLLTLMDRLPADLNDRVVVIATTNKLDSLDSAMRRPGRLDREIEIGIPTVADRADILAKLLRNVNHNLSDENVTELASVTHGFVGADLAALCTQAGMHAINRARSKSNSVVLTLADMTSPLGEIKPSALREVMIEVPKVHWDDVGGQSDLKRKLKQAVEWPLKHPEAFERMGITPPKGVLMYGPPGCSKTLIAKAVATESGLNFIAIKGPELFNKWVGESERAVREVFRKARAAAPSVVFFDEIDALASERGASSGGSQVGDRVLAQLLSEMDGLEKLQGVTILAATNRPDMIDKALLRPGRLDRIVYVPLPDGETRQEILNIQFRKMPIANEVDVEKLVGLTDGYSGAEVVAVCQEAALKTMEESLDATEVHQRHFEVALQLVKPRISSELLRFYEEYNAKGKNKAL